MLIGVCNDCLSVFSFSPTASCRCVERLGWACTVESDWNFDRVSCTSNEPVGNFEIHLMVLEWSYFVRKTMHSVAFDRCCRDFHLILVCEEKKNIIECALKLIERMTHLGCLLECFLLGLGGDAL